MCKGLNRTCCGTELPEVDLIEFADHLYCQGCLDDETEICIRCGERIWIQNNAGDEQSPLCLTCYDRYYSSCEDCGSVISLDEVYYTDDDEECPLCYSCYQRKNRSTVIHNYTYKPVPIFHGSGPRYFGVELEIDGGGENSDHARNILHLANDDEENNLYIKSDGSIDDGFELVTHPMSLDYQLHQMPWSEVLSEAKHLGYYSHQANTCGLHIHVSRDAFGFTYEEQDSAIARVLFFIEHHWTELLKFSRRTPHQLERWAARYGYMDRPKDILDQAKYGRSSGRYSCVNLQNDATIEFRIFRGTLKLNTILATLQLVDRVCDVAISLSDDEVKALSWTTFVGGCTQPELIQYLKERRLYVNDPVVVDEEV